jgi:hypothetical protein
MGQGRKLARMAHEPHIHSTIQERSQSISSFFKSGSMDKEVVAMTLKEDSRLAFSTDQKLALSKT